MGNALENAILIMNEKKTIYEYLLALPGIQSLYDSSNKDEKTEMAIFRLLYILMIKIDDNKIVDEVLKALNFNGDIISKYLNFRYPKSNKDFHKNAPKYHEAGIVQSIISKRKIDRFKKLQSILGDRQFVKA